MENTSSPSAEVVLSGLLAQSKVLKLATAGGPVSPWITAAYFVEDGVAAVHLILERTGKGMKNISANPKVAIAVDGNDPFQTFTQAEGVARVLEGEVAVRALEKLKTKVPEIAPLLMGPHSVIRIEISRWLLTSFAHGWFPAKEVRT
jgi:nitroimidazol reductase NimA-like FMN-containing flavoprotein (pyridoxamine 5'-phosphate oxidase superfamily)